MKSNADIFADRGDPWVTGRDQERDYFTGPSENPDMDKFTRAKKVPERAPEITTAKPRPAPCLDTRRKIAIALEKMHRKMREAEEAKRPIPLDGFHPHKRGTRD